MCVIFLCAGEEFVQGEAGLESDHPAEDTHPPTGRGRMCSHTLHTHIDLYVHAHTYLCAQIHAGTYTLSMLHLAVHTLPTHLLILANNKQCLSNAMGESLSFYLLIDIGHKYFGSCENVAVCSKGELPAEGRPVNWHLD